jgi:hypothetical protein
LNLRFVGLKSSINTLTFMLAANYFTESLYSLIFFFNIFLEKLEIVKPCEDRDVSMVTMGAIIVVRSSLLSSYKSCCF